MDRKEYLKAHQKAYRKLNKRVELILSPSEYKQFKQIADSEKRPVSKVIKDMATAFRDGSYYTAPNQEKAISEVSFLIRNIANNINQIAHSSNIFSDAEKESVISHLMNLDTGLKDYFSKRGAKW